MSNEINPNNYDGVNVTIVGRAGDVAKPPAYDKDGSKGLLELRIAVGQGYKKDGAWVDTGTTWYTVTSGGEYAQQLAAVGKGDKVRVDNARLETREFDRKDGTKGQSFEVKFGTVSVVESKGGASVEESPF